MIKQLTREQELKIIQTIYDNDDFVDNGGGRMVFELPCSFIYELGLSDAKDYIVKIALGEKGLAQNLLEIETYQNYCDTVALAEIPAYGQVIEIMEKVDTSFRDDFDNYYDDGYCDTDGIRELLIDDYNYEEDDAAIYAEDLSTLFSQLDDINGETGDNSQIGLNADGIFVAYDFGFDTELGCDEQCSNTRNYVDNSRYRYSLLNYILELANEDPTLFDEDNISFMAAVEKRFFDNINEDEEIYDGDEEYDGSDSNSSTACSFRPILDNTYNIDEILEAQYNHINYFNMKLNNNIVL